MVSKAERRWALWAGVVIMLLTSLPYVLGFAAQGEDWVFTGFIYGIEDGNSYLAKMMLGYNGDWLFRTPYTAYPQNGLLVLFPYILLGKLTAPPAQHDQMVALYHLFRFGSGLLVFLAAYDFVAVFVQEIKVRRWAVLMATLGGGLGWLLLFFGQTPLEFYSPETFGFLSLFGIPHLALGRALLLWGLAWYLTPAPSAVSNNQVWRFEKRGVIIGLLWLLLGVMQPLNVVVGWGVIAVHLPGLALWGMWRKGQLDWELWKGYLRRALWLGLLSSPLVLYTMIAFAIDPFAQVWTGQNILPAPPLYFYLLAYGLLLPFAVVGTKQILAKNRWLGWLLAGWAVVWLLWVYLPVGVQRRLAEGAWVALVVLATIGLANNQKLRTGLLAFSLIATAFLWVGGISLSQNPALPVFRPAQEVSFFNAIAEILPQDAVILASPKTGNALPVWIPVRVIVGHGPESIGWRELEPRIADFYHVETSDLVRLALIEENGIDFIFLGPAEQQFGDWEPDSAPYLVLVLESGEYRLFQVLK